MNRLLRLAANLGLAVVSVWAAIAFLQVADAAVKPFLPEPEWPSPFVGLVFPPNLLDEYEMRDFSCTYQINSLGFRDREVGVNKSARIRALAIGDSFTYGWGVNIEDTWCKRLEANLRKRGIDIEILDLGKPGAGPREYCRIAENAIPRLKPDLVIVCFTQTEDLLSMNGIDPDMFLQDHFGNLIQVLRYENFSRIPHWKARAANSADARKYHAECARDFLTKMSDEERARFDKLDTEVKTAFLEGKLNPWQIATGVQHPDNWKEWMTETNMPKRIKRTADRLKRILRMAHKYGADVAVTTIPNGFNVNRNSVENWKRMGFQMDPAMLTSDGPDNAIAEACKQADISSFYTVTSEFRKRIDDKGLFFPLDQHMTPAGQALFADLITPMITEDVRKAITRVSASTN